MGIATQISIKKDEDYQTFYESLVDSQYYHIIPRESTVEEDNRKRKIPVINVKNGSDKTESVEELEKEEEQEAKKEGLGRKISRVIVQKISQIEVVERVRGIPYEKAWEFIESKSYVLSLITMIAWSLCYHR